MNKFNDVYKFLIEAPEDPNKGGCRDFIKLKYTEIKQIWNRYSGFTFPDISSIDNVVVTAWESKQRSTDDCKRYRDFKTIFPLLDLVSQLYDIYQTRSRLDRARLLSQAEQIFAEWKSYVQNSSIIPLEYIPKDVWPAGVKNDFYDTKKALGAARIENFNKNFSFYEAILQCMSFRKKISAFDIFTPNSLTSDSVEPPSSQVRSKIDSIVTNIPAIISKSAPIRDKNLEEEYGSGCVNQLMEISLLIYTLYKQQINIHVTNPERVAFLEKNTDLFKQFLGIQGARPINWKNI